MNTHAAFEIDLGESATNVPLQFAIPLVGDAQALPAGTEVFFWRKGVILDEAGVSHDTWWLVDNGFVGSDGVARTASPPYPGVVAGGSYLVTSSKVEVNEDTGAVSAQVNVLDWNALWAQQAACAMSATAMGLLGPSIYGIFGSSGKSYGEMR